MKFASIELEAAFQAHWYASRQFYDTAWCVGVLAIVCMFWRAVLRHLDLTAYQWRYVFLSM